MILKQEIKSFLYIYMYKKYIYICVYKKKNNHVGQIKIKIWNIIILKINKV